MVEELALLDGILRLKGPFMVEVEIPRWFQGRVVGRGEGLVGLVMTGWVCSFAMINISGKIDLAMKQ